MHESLIGVITPEQESNLRKLAIYLLSDTLKSDFDMATWDEGCNSGDEDKIIICGSVGCAVGHGPYAGVKKSMLETWSSYSDRCFVKINPFWWFLFAADWHDIDNTPKGAAKRVLYFLENGKDVGYNITIENKRAYEEWYTNNYKTTKS